MKYMLCWKLLTSINLKRNENSPTKRAPYFIYIHQLFLWLKHANKQADINNLHTHTHMHTRLPSSFSRIAYKLPETNFSSDGRSLHYTEATQRSPTYGMSTIKAFCPLFIVQFPCTSHRPTSTSPKHLSLATFEIIKWLDDLMRIKKQAGRKCVTFWGREWGNWYIFFQWPQNGALCYSPEQLQENYRTSSPK